jgi:hypothetical protein
MGCVQSNAVAAEAVAAPESSSQEAIGVRLPQLAANLTKNSSKCSSNHPWRAQLRPPSAHNNGVFHLPKTARVCLTDASHVLS